MDPKYENALNAVPFYKIHPEYKPFVGDNYGDYKILHVGESHYIGQRKEDLRDAFPLSYFDNWWNDPCQGLYQYPSHDAGCWGSWYTTEDVIQRFLTDTSGKGYGIFANMIRSFNKVFLNKEISHVGFAEKQQYHYFAFMNFFQMPALYDGVTFWDSLYISAKKQKHTVEAKEIYETAAKESANVLDDVIEAIRPEAIIITSRSASCAYKQYGKYYESTSSPVVIQTVHPCCSWWNRKIKRFEGRTGREEMEAGLQKIK